MTIKKIESFGGELWFIRRPLFQNVIPVIKLSKGEDFEVAVVEEYGSLNQEQELIIRNDRISAEPSILDFITK